MPPLSCNVRVEVQVLHWPPLTLEQGWGISWVLLKGIGSSCCTLDLHDNSLAGRSQSASRLLATWFPLTPLGRGQAVPSLPLGGGESPNSTSCPVTSLQCGRGRVPPYSQVGVEAETLC